MNALLGICVILLLLAFAAGARLMLTSLAPQPGQRTYCGRCGHELEYESAGAAAADIGRPAAATSAPLAAPAPLATSAAPAATAPPAPLAPPAASAPLAPTTPPAPPPAASAPDARICPHCRRVLTPEQAVTCSRSAIVGGRFAAGAAIVAGVLIFGPLLLLRWPINADSAAGSGSPRAASSSATHAP